MNELQLSLVGLGLIAILLVVVYNRWLERKYRKTHGLESAAPVSAEPVVGLADEGRQEPQWAQDEPALAGMVVEPSNRVEPGLNDIDDVQGMSEPLPTLSDVEAWVDAIATLRFYEPRSAGSIRETIEQLGANRFERIECYSGDAWHLADKLPADALVSNVRCRLQLASRRGPVSPDALHAWVLAIESLAQMLSAGLSVESESTILERASSLDVFCARVDALISLNLRARDKGAMVPQFPAKLNAVGLSGSYPALARLNVYGDVDFQVLADDAQGLVSLIMDVPHVIRPDLVIAEMFDQARSLATALDAEIVDDDGRLLGDDGMLLLSNQVVRLAAMLQAQGIEPGSPLARRLFS